ncbi:hypothetical protein NV77_10570 [Staphylococcus aureus]|nr:hypothetical protein NV77_10570 [Staphylococcus aureus]
MGFPISTDNASWGGAPTKKLAESQLTIMCKLAGPNIEKLEHQFLQTMQVGGPQHREIGFPISTGNGSWGVGPNIINH